MRMGQAKDVDIAEFEPWIKKFEKFPLIYVVDLDAVMRQGSNKELLAQLTKRLGCQVGGGATTVEIVREKLAAGAKRVVVGSALISNEKIDTEFAKRLSGEIGADKLVFAVDTKQGLLALGGWKRLCLSRLKTPSACWSLTAKPSCTRTWTTARWAAWAARSLWPKRATFAKSRSGI